MGSASANRWWPWLAVVAWAVLAWVGYNAAHRAVWSPGAMFLAGTGWLLVLLLAARTAVSQLFGPVFAFEVLRLGRKRWTLVVRCLYVLALCGLLAISYLAWYESIDRRISTTDGRIPAGELSKFAAIFFFEFIVVQFIALGLVTPAYVAGCIADEKERKTLEFLLATDLQNREIVFGKLAARVGTVLMLVLAGVPILGFLQLFGGIDPELLLTGTAASVITVLGFSAVGIYFSATMRKPRDAIAFTYLSLILYLIGSFVFAMFVRTTLAFFAPTWITQTIFGYTFDLTQISDAIASGNLVYQAAFVAQSMAGMGGTSVRDAAYDALGSYAAFWAIAGTGLVLLAMARLRSSALAEPRFGTVTRKGNRVARAKPAVGDSPMVWKEVFAEPRSRTGCLGRLVVIGTVGFVFLFPAGILFSQFGDVFMIRLGLIFPDLHDWLPPFWFYTNGASVAQRWDRVADAMNAWVRGATGVLGTLLMLAAAVRGAGSVTGEMEKDTWISLTSSPLSAWEIVFGKWCGTVAGLRRGYWALFAVWATALACGGFRPYMLPVVALATAFYVSIFAWLGIWCSVTARTSLIATVRAVLLGVTVIGGFWVVTAFCCILPLETMDRTVFRSIEPFLSGLLGATPPIVIGWLPWSHDENHEYGPFGWRETMFGPYLPIFGAMVWLAFGFLLAYRSHAGLSKLANRRKSYRRKIRQHGYE